MATFSSIFSPADNGVQFTTAATTASAEKVLATNNIFAINASEDITIAFGVSGMAAPTGVEFIIPAGTTTQFDLGPAFDRFRIYNLGASTATVSYIALRRV